MIDIDGFERYLYDEELSKNTRESYMFSIKKDLKYKLIMRRDLAA